MADPSDPEGGGAQQAEASGDTHEPAPLAELHPGRGPRRRISAERMIAVAAVIALVVTASIVVVVQHRGANGLQRPPNTNPLIAVVDAAGSTSLVDGTGHRRPLPGQANVSTAFPAWSPD